jgi:glycosyltransferase involved in cell wall biosynthesis
MRVLYVSHTAAVSGGERSLLDLLAALPPSVSALVATPTGRLSEAVQAIGVPTVPITGTAGSLRLHPAHTPRAMVEVARAAWQVHRAARAHGADLIHANSIRAGVVAGLSQAPTLVPPIGGRGVAQGRRAAAPRMVTHVRDCLPGGPVATATMRSVAATADLVLANSHYTGRWIDAVAPGARVEVVYNGIDQGRFDRSRIDGDAVRASLGAAGGRRPLLGVVGQLSEWKGHETAIEALGLLCAEGLDAHLLLIGAAVFVARATRFDNQAYVAHLRDVIARAGLADRVTFVGEREDVPELMATLDALLLPSREEPFGRAVIEAMALEVPVVATTVGGPAEIVTDGVEGYLRDPGDSRGWAQAVRALVEDPSAADEMGRRGRARVQGAFTTAHHVAAVLDVYERTLAGDRPEAHDAGDSRG